MIYVISPKNLYAVERLLKEAKFLNYKLRILDLKSLVSKGFRIPITSRDVLYVRNPYLSPVRSLMRSRASSPDESGLTSNGVNGDPKYIPNIIKLAKNFKAKGGRVVDANIAKGEIGKGKWEDYKKLKKAGLLIPKTTKIVDSEQWSVISKQKETNYSLPTTHFPLVLKWIYGMKAKGTFLIQNQKQLKKILPLHPKQEWLVQEFIKAKYEYKVICIGYKALPVVLRFEFNKSLGRADFNSFDVLACHPGSGFGIQKIKEYHSGSFLPLEGGGGEGVKTVIRKAEQASKTLGRELSKVDILEDQRGRLYILEVNRFPGLKSFEQLTKFNVFGKFIEYLQKVV